MDETEELQRVKLELEASQKRVTELEKEIDEKHNKLQTLERDNASLQTDHADEIKTVEDTYKSIQNCIRNEFRRKRDELHAAIDTMKVRHADELKNLHDDINRNNACHEEQIKTNESTWEDKYAALNSQLEESRDQNREIVKIKQELNDSQQRIDAKQKEITKNNTIIDELHSDINTMKEHHADELKELHNDINRNNACHEQQIKTSEKTWEDKYAALNSQLEESRDQNREIVKIKQELNESQQRINAKQKDITKNNAIIDELHADINTMKEHHADELNKLHNDINRNNECHEEQIKTNENTWENKYAALNSQLEESREQNRELAKIKQGLNESQQRINAKQKEITMNNTIIDDLHADINTMKEHHADELKELHNDINRNNACHEEQIKTNEKTWEDKYATLNSQLEESRDQNRDIKQELTESQQRINAKQKEITKNNTTIDELHAEIDTIKVRHADELKKLQDDINRNNASHEEQIKTNEKTWEDKYTAVNIQLEESRTKNNITIDELHAEIDTIKVRHANELKNLHDDINRNNASHEEQIKTNENTWEDKYATLNSQLKESRDQNQELVKIKQELTESQQRINMKQKEFKPPTGASSRSTPSSGVTGSEKYLAAITAAIDFGTVSSGYAFAYGKDYNTRIHTSSWAFAKDTTDRTAKAPTTVLFEPDKKFHSFGYEAEEKYALLCGQEKQAGWRYFRRFKMLLYQTKKLDMKTNICDAENKPMPAIEVFTAAIHYLKETLLKQIRLEKDDVEEDDILFVLTVPAIWSDAAKQFMREASKLAGIKNDQLKLALEPEAASVMCTKIESRRQETAGNVSFGRFPVGHRYIVADLGGGTADIATHEVIENGQLHELHYVLGNGLGSTQFDEEFLEFISELFGKKLFEEWTTTKPRDYLQLLRRIEGLKWSLSTSDEELILDIPITLCKKSKKLFGNTVDKKLKQKEYKELVTASIEDGTLQMKNEFVVKFFNKTIEGVNNIIQDIVRDKSISDIETIVIVGGLSKSAYVRDCIKRAFPSMHILVPEDSGLSVMKGAVLLGNRPQTIAGRIARYTYGVKVKELFIEGKHREDYKFTHDGEVLCNHVFRTIIKKGTVMSYGQRFTTETRIDARQPETKRKTFTTYLYQSTEEEPEYSTDPGCTNIGGFDEKPPEGGWPDYTSSVVEIIVGEAEFQFRLKNDRGEERELKVDFLSTN